MVAPLAWTDDALEVLDQTLLPAEEVRLRCTEPEQVADAIRRLAVRGAPAIGLAAAYGVALGMRGVADAELDSRFEAVCDLLGRTRPTAVDLSWALARARETFVAARAAGPEAVAAALLERAHSIAADRRAGDAALAAHGAALVGRGERVLTHCNTGALATGGSGTAGGVIEAAWRAGGVELVWVDETRPLLQGARLTAWELGRAGVPFRVVPDSSAGALMSRGLVDRVVVGADRIAANGDVANKIGTYTVAVLAARHGVPFHVAAPLSTIDVGTASGAGIVIEERSPDEVTSVLGVRIAPAGAGAANFAFDVTPADLVTSIVTEAGVLEPPYEESIARAAGR
ncbi:MAG: methylthioribose-phosphate isomerase [Thermoleophilaceae bacterium]|nr:methylthioribose-phosphate isomerase [Thermoleophilaceae bacterium]